MTAFWEIGDDGPALAFSPKLRAFEKTFGYIAERGAIGLTASRAFKRMIASPRPSR